VRTLGARHVRSSLLTFRLWISLRHELECLKERGIGWSLSALGLGAPAYIEAPVGAEGLSLWVDGIPAPCSLLFLFSCSLLPAPWYLLLLFSSSR